MGTVSDCGSSVCEAPVMQGGVAMELRKGPWTVEEDLVLVNYIAVHGEGRWNSLARSAGLKRSGKSCRLRWLNYLRPDVRRGNFTPEEQLLILDLHSRLGNRWSKIAQQLPGRTDNEVKNYWRTRVQKHARQLKCDVGSQQFKDAVRHLWIPHLMERICAAAASTAANATAACVAATSTSTLANTCVVPFTTAEAMRGQAPGDDAHVTLSPDHPSTAGASSDSSAGTWPSSPSLSDLTADCHVVQGFSSSSDYGDEFTAFVAGGCSGSLLSPCGYNQPCFPDFEQIGCGAAGGFSSDNLWATDDDIWF